MNEANNLGQTTLHCHPLEYRLDLSHDKKLSDAPFQCIQLLVENAADVNICQQDGQSPLHRALEARHASCLSIRS